MTDRLPLLSALFFAPLLAAKGPIPTPSNDPFVGPIEPYFFKNILQNEDLDDSVANHWNDPELRIIVEKHGIELFGGPM
ncbi:uncharacterized protein METZ01_LOCUS497418, partial [marine metagenome]